MPRVAISGARGLVGRAVESRLRHEGWQVTALAREDRDGAIRWNPDGPWDASPLDGFDAVVHLAGESVAERWSDEQKKRIMDSRVHGTRSISEALAGLAAPPPVLVCASAVGFYGDRKDEEVTEDSPRGAGFLADVVEAWEAAAEPARAAGIRVVSMRLGVVLSTHGGALPKMLTPFRLGMGGPVGSGRQYMSWITLDDAARAFAFAVEHAELSGAVNVVTPNAARNKAFAKTLGKVLRRPAVMPVPATAIKMMFGEMGEEVLLAGARVTPTRLQAAAFPYQHAELEMALRAVLAE